MKVKTYTFLFIVITALFSINGYTKEIGRWNQLQFNSNPAVNFHHFIFEMARTDENINDQGWKRTLTPNEQQILKGVIEFYKTNFIGKRRSPMRTMPWL